MFMEAIAFVFVAIGLAIIRIGGETIWAMCELAWKWAHWAGTRETLDVDRDNQAAIAALIALGWDEKKASDAVLAETKKSDAVLALMSMGFSRVEANAMVRRMVK
jgi:Holliday junction resolvasome RuvABC DNA-binding subunit